MKTDNDRASGSLDDDTRRARVAAFIGALRQRLGGVVAQTALPRQFEATVRQVEHDEDLPARFTLAARSVGINVHSATITDWPGVVAELLQAQRACTAKLPPTGDGFFDAQRVEQMEHQLRVLRVTPRRATDDETLFSVDVAITGVVAAIAETGTLVCESGPAVARGSSLIPPVHIAVVGAGQLLPDLHDYAERLSGRSSLPASIVLISGPSKTADIEGVLVTGVHGPGDVHVVLVQEQ